MAKADHFGRGLKNLIELLETKVSQGQKFQRVAPSLIVSSPMRGVFYGGFGESERAWQIGFA